MKLSEFYKAVITCGARIDPRTDKHTISSYADTAILHGDGFLDVRKLLIGIDIDGTELLLADKLGSRGGLDLVLSHHPSGKALSSLYEVMQLQVALLVRVGIKRDVAQGLLNMRKSEVERKLLPVNHMRAVDMARLLDIPFMCSHTPADNHAAWFIQRLLNQKKPKRLEDILDALMEIPEYKIAREESCGPRIILGNPKRAAGKIFVEMTGGTEGPKEVYDSFDKAGIRTLVSMHLSEEHFKKVKDAHLNVVIAGHVSSDTLGMNLLLDNVQKAAQERFQIIECAGFRRVQRG